MSSVVKSVGNAVGSVVKGAVNVVSSVAKGVGNLASEISKSKLGKAMLIAAAIYFGGAALSGGFGAPAGTSFFSGMGTGVANAASSLSTAWTSAMSGNFSQAGSALSSGFQGEVAGSTAANLGVGTTPLPAAPPVAAPPVAAPPVAAPPVAPVTASITPGAAGNGMRVSSSSLGGNLGSSLSTLPPSIAPPPPPPPVSMLDKVIASPYTAPALISGGMQVSGAIIQGKSQEKQLREQRENEERTAREARDRYNTNAGATLFAANQDPIYQSDQAAFDPYAEARARSAARYGPRPTGVVARYMPTTA